MDNTMELDRAFLETLDQDTVVHFSYQFKIRDLLRDGYDGIVADVREQAELQIRHTMMEYGFVKHNPITTELYQRNENGRWIKADLPTDDEIVNG